MLTGLLGIAGIPVISIKGERLRLSMGSFQRRRLGLPVGSGVARLASGAANAG
jgi:hypothetical protein